MSDSDDLTPYEVNPLKNAKPVSGSVSELASALNAGEGTTFDPFESAMAGVRAGNAIVEILKLVVVISIRGIIAPVESVLRRRFGERYFNSWVLGAVCAVFGTIAAFEIIEREYALGILGVFLFFAYVNRIHCFVRDRKGDYWHSYSEGDSWMRLASLDRFFARWYFTFDFSKLVVEPLVVVVIALAINQVWVERMQFLLWSLESNPISIYLYVAAAFLFVHQLYCYVYRRNQLLDEKDTMLIAEVRAKLASKDEAPGISSFKGISYAVLGGKKDWKK